MNILAKQAGIILTSSMTYNKTLLNLSKTKRVINIGVACFKSQCNKELQQQAELYIKDMINVEKARLWFVDHQENKLYSYNTHLKDSDTFVIQGLKAGLIGRAVHEKEIFNCIEPSRNTSFNQIVDIHTDLPLVTVPVLDYSQKSVIGVVQFVHLKSYFHSDSLRKEDYEYEMIELFASMMSACMEKISKLDTFRKSRGTFIEE